MPRMGALGGRAFMWLSWVSVYVAAAAGLHLTCPEGWHGRLQDSEWCYKLSDEAVSFREAEAGAAGCGLASFPSHAELMAVGPMLGAAGGVWIGLWHDLETSKWRWLDEDVAFNTGLVGLGDLLVNRERVCAAYDAQEKAVAPADCGEKRRAVCRQSRLANAGGRVVTVAAADRIDAAALPPGQSAVLLGQDKTVTELRAVPVRGFAFTLSLPAAVDSVETRTEWGGTTYLYPVNGTVPYVVPQNSTDTAAAGEDGAVLDLLTMSFCTVRVRGFAFGSFVRSTYISTAYGMPTLEIEWRLGGGDAVLAKLDVLDLSRPHSYFVQAQGTGVQVIVDGEVRFHAECRAGACPEVYPAHAILEEHPAVTPGALSIERLRILSDAPIEPAQALPLLSGRGFFSRVAALPIPDCWGAVATGPVRGEAGFVAVPVYTVDHCMQACVQRDWCAGVGWDYQVNCLLLVVTGYRSGLVGGRYAYPSAEALNNRDGLPAAIFSTPTLTHFNMMCYKRQQRVDPTARGAYVDLVSVDRALVAAGGYESQGGVPLPPLAGGGDLPACTQLALSQLSFGECSGSQGLRYRSPSKCAVRHVPAGAAAIHRCKREHQRSHVATGCVRYSTEVSWRPAAACPAALWWVQRSLGSPVDPGIIRIHSLRDYADTAYAVYSCGLDPYTEELTCIPVQTCRTRPEKQHRFADCAVNTTLLLYRIAVLSIGHINATSGPDLLPVITDIEAGGELTETERFFIEASDVDVDPTGRVTKVLALVLGAAMTGLYVMGIGAHAKRAKKLMDLPSDMRGRPVVAQGATSPPPQQPPPHEDGEDGDREEAVEHSVDFEQSVDTQVSISAAAGSKLPGSNPDARAGSRRHHGRAPPPPLNSGGNPQRPPLRPTAPPAPLDLVISDNAPPPASAPRDPSGEGDAL
eukprot:TRINITY_DN1946_c0_g1_i1.p1 TRINITY_DN1946_c0_g1~~TRINITY_DN1946_c0_g1_i1.p1  ORF type:complete len:916 (+),score=257.47 TRINITY_DN1946_c0_g1_i1:136-2883(+)